MQECNYMLLGMQPSAQMSAEVVSIPGPFDTGKFDLDCLGASGILWNVMWVLSCERVCFPACTMTAQQPDVSIVCI